MNNQMSIGDCDSGWEYNATSDACQRCSDGLYRNKSESDKCISCPDTDTNKRPNADATACDVGTFLVQVSKYNFSKK